MKKLILLALLLAEAAWAITIPVPLTSGVTTEQIVSLTDLNGTALNGQTIDIDIAFTDGKYVRLLPATPAFYSLLVLLVNAEPGGFTSGQGTFLDASLNPIVELPLGSATSTAPFVASVLTLPTPITTSLDVYGVHYSVNLPSGGAEIIGTELRLLGTGPFIVAPLPPGVPDGSSAVALLGLGALALFGFYNAQRQSSPKPIDKEGRSAFAL